MPILAVTPPVTPPVTAVNPFTDTRLLALATLDIDPSLVFNGVRDSQWTIMNGVTGLGLPPVEWVTQATPGMDGAWLREVHVGPREVFLPVFMASDESHLDFLARKDRLMSFLDWTVADPNVNDGTFLLVATSVLGSRILRVAYNGGFEGEEGGLPGGAWWTTFGLKLLAVDPWWRAVNSTTLQFGVGGGSPFLASAGSGNRWPRALSSSVSVGEGMPIAVGGAVPVWPTVEIDGPATSVTVTTSTGMAVNTTEIADDETLTLVTDPRRRSASIAGVRAWERVGVGPQFATIGPSATTFNVSAPGATTNTRIRVTWQPGWKTAW